MMRSFFLIAFLVTYALFVVSAEADDGDTDEYICSSDADKLLEQGNAAFTGRFLYESYKKTPDKNLIMSPYCVFAPLAQLGLYAEGDTRDQILNVLNLPNKCDIPCVFPKLINGLREEQNVILNVASKIYSTDIYPLSENFLNDTRDIFDSSADNININDPQGSADKINKWVEDQTNNRIKDIAKKDMITPDTRLMLVNAIYFLGNWTHQFNEKSTIDRDFYINSNKIVKVPTMYQQNTFRYGESSDLNCKVLELTYKGGNFSFVIFLPNEIEGLSPLVDSLQDQSKFYKAYDGASYEKVNVYVPKLKTESEFNLKEIMEKVGIVDLLSPAKSNLDGILEKYEPLYVSTAIMKAFLDFNEVGTEAAAASLFGVGASITSVGGPQPPIYLFRADHPFAFYVLNKRNIIFSGTCVTN